MRFVWQTLRLVVLAVIGFGFLYLFTWPVPFAPLAWSAPKAPRLEDTYQPNNALGAIERVGQGIGIGPEDVAIGAEGRIYTGMEDGRIVRIDPDGETHEIFANTGGRPLGLAFDAEGNLIVADANEGLLSITPDGYTRRLSRGADDRPNRLTNDLDIAPDGKIYFSDASYRFPLAEYTTDLMEHRPNGRLLVYDPATDSTTVALWPLYFGNGVAVSPDGKFVLVVETGRYRVLRLWLKGPKAGTSEIFIDNLPGFPDGISADEDGNFWLALVAPRDPGVDFMLDRPYLRKLVMRLPEAVRPRPKRYGFVLGLDADGNVIHNLQDPDASYAHISSVQRHGDTLYVGSISEDAVGRLPAP